MGKSFGIGWRQAYNLAQVWETFFKGENGEFCNQWQNCALDEVTWYITTRRDRRPEVLAGLRRGPQGRGPLLHHRRPQGRDPHGRREAGAEGTSGTGTLNCRWLRVYCARLDQVVSQERCGGCEQLQSP